MIRALLVLAASSFAFAVILTVARAMLTVSLENPAVIVVVLLIAALIWRSHRIDIRTARRNYPNVDAAFTRVEQAKKARRAANRNYRKVARGHA